MLLRYLPPSLNDTLLIKILVQVIGVQVCGDDHLEAVAPHTPRRFNPDLMRLLRRDLARREALIAVIGDDLAALSVFALDSHHLLIRRRLGTVQ